MTDVEQIKDNIDVVDLIGEYIQLKPAGNRHKGLCPFHNEKTPSFMASRDRQGWHCFGCGKGGDIFTFIQEIEGMTFVDALQFLAQKAGVTLSQQPRGNKEEMSKKQVLRKIMEEAVQFYHNFLRKIPSAKPALAYLHDRGLTDQTIDTWEIGFIPDQWDLLTKYLLKKGYSIDDLILAGITIKKEQSSYGKTGFYDRFRGRIMFPIRDEHGYAVGFTGRVLVETERSGGKYVNTPQTPLFDKSRLVFALDKAKKTIKNEDLVVLVEGQMDVIAVYQSGMHNVAATSGTAMTAQHVKLLKRYTHNIAIAFDADEAGQKAAKRGIDLATEAGMNVKIIQIPEGAGADPDDCIKRDPAVWEQAVKDAVDVMQWYMVRAFAGKDLSNPKDKQAVANEMLPEIARIPFSVERDHWLQQLAQRLQVDIVVLREDIRRFQGQEEGGQYKAESTASELSEKAEKTRSFTEMIQEQLLSLVLSRSHINDELLGLLHVDMFSSPYQALYESIKTAYNQAGNLHAFIASSSDEQFVRILLLKGDEEFSLLSDTDVAQQALQLAKRVKDGYIKKQREQIMIALEDAQSQKDIARVQALLQQIQSLS